MDLLRRVHQEQELVALTVLALARRGIERSRSGHGRVRDLPTKRNLHAQFTRSAGSRTGADQGEVRSPVKHRAAGDPVDGGELRAELESRREKDLRNKLIDQQREKEASLGRHGDWSTKDHEGHHMNYQSRSRGAAEASGARGHGVDTRAKGKFRRHHRREYRPIHQTQSVPGSGVDSRKRGTKQIWVAKDALDRQGDGEVFVHDTRRKTSNVFECISEQLKVHLAEWKMANETKASQSEPQPIQKWEPPDFGWVKIYSDGAVSRAGTNGGGGTVFRDHQAAFVVRASSFFTGIVDPEAVEALACRKAIQMAIDLNNPASAFGIGLQDTSSKD
ncbi:Boron transporter-like protein 2 [Hordeum vulgare]|nr:Boron transporter-like protein 2 [Hordeum vulgare]